jgi:hypothetical protein
VVIFLLVEVGKAIFRRTVEGHPGALDRPSGEASAELEPEPNP